MKHLFACFILLLCGNIKAQTYLHQTSTWTETMAYCGFTGDCDIFNFARTLSGDTLINGYIYHRVVTAGTHSVYDLSEQEIVLVEPYTTADEFVREDQNRFLRYHEGINDDIVIADFDLAVGDTAVNRGCQSELVVDHIDTVYLGQEPRRRYFFRPGNDNHNFLIEGVGSNAGLFNSPCSEIGIEAGSSLECFSQEDELIVVDSAAACNTTTSIGEPDFSTIGIRVFPNPASEYIHIAFDTKEMHEPVTIQIYSMPGQLLSTHVFDGQEMVRVVTDELIAGMYVVSIQLGDRVVNTRIIKN